MGLDHKDDKIADIENRLYEAGFAPVDVTPISDALRAVAPAKLPDVDLELRRAMAETEEMARSERASVVGDRIRSVLAGIGTLAAAGAIAAKLILTPATGADHVTKDQKNLPLIPAKKQGNGQTGCDPMQPNDVPEGLDGVSGTCIYQVKSDGKHVYDLRLENAGLLMDPKNPYEVELKWGNARAVADKLAPAINVKYNSNSARVEGSDVYSVVMDESRPGVVIFINEQGESLVEATYKTAGVGGAGTGQESKLITEQGGWVEVHLEDDIEPAQKNLQAVQENSNCAMKLAGGETKDYAAAMAIIACMIALQERRRRSVKK